MPVYRLTASSIISSFRVSGKHHLLLTGGRGTGKTTLLRALVPLLCPGAQEITTAAYPADRVEIRESVGGKIAVIGRFDPALPPGENRMRPVADGFLLLGVPALHRMAAGESEWAVLDELGYLENSCPEFRQAVEALLDAKRVLAVVRKQDTPFLTALCARQDAFVVDLDDPAPALGCVVMASGLGRRFGGNKLMADFCGAPLIANALALAALPLLACRIVVTRSEEVEALCNAQGVPVLRHAQPYRSDTVRLGLAAFWEKSPLCAAACFCRGTSRCSRSKVWKHWRWQRPPMPLCGCALPMAPPAAQCCSARIIFRSCFTCRMAAAAMPLRGPTPVPSALCPPGTMPN